MSNPNSNTPKQTNKATTRGDGSKNTSSDEASFTLVIIYSGLLSKKVERYRAYGAA
jgi:hypothetical protein